MEILSIVFGAIIGSFLTSLTYRLPRKIDLVRGRSFCPHCKKQIAWYDNLPLLGYILLRGRCRNCGKRISLRYPLIELGTTLLFLTLFLAINNCPQVTSDNILCIWKIDFGYLSYLFTSFVTAILIAIFVIDLEKKIIPDELVFGGLLIVFLFFVLANPTVIFSRFLIGFLISIFFLIVHLATKGRGMGLGDVKFVILGGVLLGWPQSAAWLFLSFALGAVIGLILILLKKTKFGREIPFGPFLVGALFITILFGEKIINLYR